eukprot:jgi/Tetstr1/457998/TSEL_044509.t1
MGLRTSLSGLQPGKSRTSALPAAGARRCRTLPSSSWPARPRPRARRTASDMAGTVAILQERPSQAPRTRQGAPRPSSPPADLPRSYDRAALEAWCERRPMEMNRRWADFMRLTVPLFARVGASFSLGTLERDEVALARETARVLSQLGPTFVKLGQLLSSRQDLMSPAVAAELGRLQSNVAPFSDAAALKAIEVELGYPVGEVFSELDPVNVAAASLSQVYKGRLLSGEAVAVKVQRLDALGLVAQDLVILRRGLEHYKSTIFKLTHEMGITGEAFTSRDLDALLTTWASGFYEELDFSREAGRQASFRGAIVGRLPHCYVPAVFADLCTQRLMVSEWVDATKISDCPPEEITHLMDAAARCFCFQLLELGQFHGDPHAGNMLRLEGEAGGPPRLCLIDFGLVADIPEGARPALAGGLVHLTECNWPRWVDALIDLGVLDEETLDRPRVEALSDRLLRPFLSGGGATAIAERFDTSTLMADLAESAGVRVATPPYFALLSRAISILEGVALGVDPEYSILGAAAPLAAQWLIAEGALERSDRPAEGRSGGAGNGSQDAVLEMLTSATASTTPERAELARWVLSSDSAAATATLRQVLALPVQAGDKEMDPALAAPMRLLDLAKLATTGWVARGGEGHPCADVQRAFQFLLQSSTPQVQEQVVTQAAHAADLCSRYIMQGLDAPGGLVPAPELPAAVQGVAQLALDALFPPLSAEEAERARELVVVAINTLGVRDMEELQELLVPWAMLKGLRDGTPLQHLQRLMDTALVGHPASMAVHQEMLARVGGTYVSRLTPF